MSDPSGSASDERRFGERNTCLGFELARLWPSRWDRGGCDGSRRLPEAARTEQTEIERSNSLQ